MRAATAVQSINRPLGKIRHAKIKEAKEYSEDKITVGLPEKLEN